MATNWLLPVGETLSFRGLSGPLTILAGLGGGTQGQVFEVLYSGEHLALKWYFPSFLPRDPELEQRLGQSIRATAPSDDFLWPLALLKAADDDALAAYRGVPNLGYLMALRPSAFVSAFDHITARVDLSLQNALRACFHLAEGFHALHSSGLCYKDISLGNLFLKPDDGTILICDNDNVDIHGRGQTAVLGTPGFMAPEVVLGQAPPSNSSDLFSLAVLMFRLLTKHDPFRGEAELAFSCLNDSARRHLYGEHPVFVFDPSNPCNRPDPSNHLAALITWPIYPRLLQQTFEQTFCAGLRDPGRRVLTGQWKTVLSQVLDQRRLCPGCGYENFAGAAGGGLCWNCGSELSAVAMLNGPQASICIAAGNALHAHHFSPLAGESIDKPLGQIVPHPSEPTVLGIENTSQESWQVSLRNGQVLQLEPGQRCNAAAVATLQTSLGRLSTA